MEAQRRNSLFVQAALASGLVSEEKLREARELTAVAAPARVADDETLAERFVAMGLLNEWQVEQLREGRTKFSLGPYQILDAVAKGGMGHVFLGQHEMLGRVEAIKVLPKSKSKPTAIASFLHEIRAQAQLDHPNLVRVSYADREGDTYFLVTEYVPGVDLRRLVRRCGPLSTEQAAWVITQAAQGLECAHRRGIVHRDVKPGNLLVTPEGNVKVADLGLAWYLNNEEPPTSEGKPKIVGTCDYLAPEVINDPSLIIPVSDIYALGCTLYYAVTGKVPYPGGNAVQKMRRRMKEAPLRPLSIRPDLPQPIVDVLDEMMAKDPKQRTPSAAVVIQRLAGLLGAESRLAVAERVQQHQAAARSRRAPDGRRAAPHLSDTLDGDEAYLPEDVLPHESSGAQGHASQGTEPMDGSDQSTQEFVREPARPAARRGPLLDRVVWAIAAAAILATLAIVAAAILAPS